MNGEAGKGDSFRPVNKAKYDENYIRIFGEKEMIIKCTCKHEFQDARYGKGIRVHNKIKSKSSGMEEFRCTVCGTVRGSR